MTTEDHMRHLLEALDRFFADVSAANRRQLLAAAKVAQDHMNRVTLQQGARP